jgi:translation initiation factor 2 alpha subunit (eIF-2alpha)
MNAPLKKPSRPAYRLIKKGNRSKAATRRLARAMKRVSDAIEKSGRREELLRDLPPTLRD